jgi:hypothetical protein
MGSPEEIKDWVSENFCIPRPPWRLNADQKNASFADKCRLNPIEDFHDLYQCHEKGREGSATYDAAGFELD